ncbi:MAG: hypothetical protein ACRDNP_07455 [Gaiellaceae bacterium]
MLRAARDIVAGSTVTDAATKVDVDRRTLARRLPGKGSVAVRAVEYIRAHDREQARIRQQRRRANQAEIAAQFEPERRGAHILTVAQPGDWEPFVRDATGATVNFEIESLRSRTDFGRHATVCTASYSRCAERYASGARSTDGMDIAGAISQVDSDSCDYPVEAVTMNRVELGSS